MTTLADKSTEPALARAITIIHNGNLDARKPREMATDIFLMMYVAVVEVFADEMTSAGVRPSEAKIRATLAADRLFSNRAKAAPIIK